MDAQLLLGEPVALLLGGQQRGEEVVARVGPALLEDAVEVVDQRHEGEQPALDGGLVEVAVEHPGRVGAPRAEEVPVLGGDAEQLADHRDRAAGSRGRR